MNNALGIYCKITKTLNSVHKIYVIITFTEVRLSMHAILSSKANQLQIYIFKKIVRIKTLDLKKSKESYGVPFVSKL